MALYSDGFFLVPLLQSCMASCNWMKWKLHHTVNYSEGTQTSALDSTRTTFLLCCSCSNSPSNLATLLIWILVMVITWKPSLALHNLSYMIQFQRLKGNIVVDRRCKLQAQSFQH